MLIKAGADLEIWLMKGQCKKLNQRERDDKLAWRLDFSMHMNLSTFLGLKSPVLTFLTFVSNRGLRSYKSLSHKKKLTLGSNSMLNHHFGTAEEPLLTHFLALYGARGTDWSKSYGLGINRQNICRLCSSQSFDKYLAKPTSLFLPVTWLENQLQVVRRMGR